MRIYIGSYNPEWPALFATEKVCIANALGHDQIAIEHIGSTSVYGLPAKPIIDILVGLPRESELDKSIAPMVAAGYTYGKKYEPLWPARRFFMRLQAGEKPLPSLIDTHDNYIIGEDFISLVHIHIIVKDTHDWIRHIAFREYLRNHPIAKDEYGQLKQQLARQDFQDGLAYNDAKDAFVKHTESQALNWYQQQQSGSHHAH